LHKLDHDGWLSRDAVLEIRRRVGAGEQQKAVAADLSISTATISRIARGLMWAAITEQESA
jgi:uncharacterized protein YerC